MGCSAAFAFAAICASGARADQASTLDSATQALMQGDNSSAASLFTQVLADPNLSSDGLVQASLGRGQAYLGLERFSDALDDCKKALNLDQVSSAALNCLGLAYRGLRKLDMAEDAFNKAIKQSPDDPALFVNRGALYDLRGVPNLAIADESQALQLTPDLPSAYTERAAAHFQLGQFDQAIDDDTLALRSGLPNPKALNDRGLAFAEMRRGGQAIEDLRKAKRLLPDDAVIATNLKMVEARFPADAAAPTASEPAPAPSPPQAQAQTPAPPQPHPALVFTRPQLAAISDVTPPPRFCSAVERNKFMDEVYTPAQASAKSNGDKSAQYKSDLLDQLSAKTSAPNDGSDDINLIRAEITDYTPIADAAYQRGKQLTDQYQAIMAVPLGGC